MAYPRYKTIKKKSLWWSYKSKIKDGWSDMGQTESLVKDGDYWVAFRCKVCGDNLRVGREKDKSFIYCPRCFSRKFVKNK